MAAIADLSEDDIDAMQEFCILQVPEYIRKTMPPENRYRLQTIIATDLGKYVKFEVLLKQIYSTLNPVTCLH